MQIDMNVLSVFCLNYHNFKKQYVKIQISFFFLKFGSKNSCRSVTKNYYSSKNESSSLSKHFLGRMHSEVKAIFHDKHFVQTKHSY